MLHLYKATGSGALEPELKIENNHNTSSVTDGAGRLTFYSDDSNNSGIPDLAWLGQVRFMGDDKDGSAQEFEYAYMVGQARDPGSGTARKGGLSFYTRNGNSITETLTITEDKVGIGTTSPSSYHSLADDLVIASASDTGITIASGTSSDGRIFFADGTSGSAESEGQIRYDHNGNYMAIHTADSERMRINSSGNLLVGTTSAVTTGGEGIELRGDYGYFKTARNNSGSVGHWNIINSNGEVGSVTTSGSATQFNTSSDARLKDVTGEAKGLEVINALNPVAFNWKADNTEDEGLLAQEVKEIVPNAVSQGEDEYYQMDYSKLVTPLIKAVQEQQEQIEELKQEIEALKNG
jgi:hypothetical protein